MHDLWRAGLGRREAQQKMTARLTTIEGVSRENFLRPSPFGGGRVCRLGLGCPAAGSERGGDFVEPRMALEGFGQFLDAGINATLADTVAGGVTVNAGQCAGLAHGKHEVVKLALLCGDHGVNGAEGVTAGGVFIGGQVAGVGNVAGANTAGGVVVVVGVRFVNGEVGDVALLLLARHEAEDGVGDLLLVELRLAGLVEVAGGLAKLLVGEIINGLVGGDVACAESETVKGAGNAGSQGVVLVDAGLEGQPCLVLAGGDDFSIPLTGGWGCCRRVGRNGSHRRSGARCHRAPW